jgi:hypothetical protein
MKTEIKEAIHFTFIIGIWITFITIFPKDDEAFGWTHYLILTIAIILTSVKIILTIIPYLTGNVKIIWSKKKAKERAEKIYEFAMENGGDLLSTHVYPIERIPNPDGLKSIFLKCKKKLSFKRIIYTDDPMELDKTIRSTFESKTDLINIEVIVPNSSSLLPKFIWYFFPRINITSYYNEKLRKAKTSIGLYRIYTEDNTRDKSLISPTIHFYSTKINLALKIREYFKSLKNGQSNHFESINEYEISKRKIIFQARYKSFISRLLVLCEDASLGVLHVSLFGQYAAFEKGIFDLGDLKIDFDIDILMVCERGRKDLLKERINKILEEMGLAFNIIWGPLNDEFYSYRQENVLTVDIELFEEGDDYYFKHNLLGHSILPSCLAIYTEDQTQNRLFQLLKFPESLISTKERAKAYLESRKGLEDFKQLMDINKGIYNPTRVISHIIRNSTWVLTGNFEPSYQKAYNFFKKEYSDFYSEKVLTKATEIVFDKVSIDRSKQYKITEKVLNETILKIEELIN